MPRILIVDDERQNRESLLRALSDLHPDWECLVAENEFEGKVKIESALTSGKPIDVVLTDLVMATEESGINMLREARKLDPLIIAILFTAKETNLDPYLAFDCGAYDVVTKNMPGIRAVEKIEQKTRDAVAYRQSRMASLARRYFDPRLYDMIERDPTLLTVSRRVITIVFWDIRGFSNLCEILKAHPDVLLRFLQAYCEMAARTIFRHGGLLDKFIGDGIMALFGVAYSRSKCNACSRRKGRSGTLTRSSAKKEPSLRYHQITPDERYRLAALRTQHPPLSNVAIARQLGRHPSTVGRELRRNSTKYDGAYRPSRAQENTNGRRSRCRRGSAFTAREWMLVEDLLSVGWSPEQISGRLRLEGRLRISHETIYKYVWADKHAGGSLHLWLRQRTRSIESVTPPRSVEVVWPGRGTSPNARGPWRNDVKWVTGKSTRFTVAGVIRWRQSWNG